MSQTDLSLRSHALGSVCRSGDVCPQAGLWKCLASKPQSRIVQKNERFPDVDGRAVFWHLAGYIG
ncbi:hypothetical protein R0381_000374 [Jeongeupia wiesaeckerbachi]|uniref:hypothetical protein n=1 Tax=Jeongeupia wiesaeckerbachi TaxID=3051218 RepID=UPI003D8048A0